MNKRGLKSKIKKKLDQLSKLLDNIDEVRNIDSEDPDTWDSDTLYNTIEVLKEVLQLLQDQKSKQLDEFGQPIILEEGLCSLVDEYQSEEEGISDDE